MLDGDVPAIDLESLARQAVRHPSSGYADLLARLATDGRFDGQGLQDIARSAPRGPALAAAAASLLDGPLDPEALGWFALVRAALPRGDAALSDVATLVELAHLAGRPKELLPRFQGLWLDALFLEGDTSRYPYPRPSGDTTGPEWRVRVDELNPFLAAPGPPRGTGVPEGTAAWLAAFNEVFTDHGLAPVTLQEGSTWPLHRLRGRAEQTTGEMPLVTVVMPMHEPGEDLRFALASVLGQSWQHLEVLLCDDGSGPGTQGLLAECAATDPRVRVLRNPRNAGVYAARNLGLTAARGEFVTFQDSDDWSHPQRIERQVAPLLDNPGILATISRMVRVDERLGLTVLGYPAGGANAQSLLFRRDPVLRRLGGFDSVRRSGDNEFTGRIQAVFGRRSVLRMPEVLALLQRTAGSLSRTDMRLLFTHPAREHYRFAYRQWHSRIQQGSESPYVLPPQRIPSPAHERISGVTGEPQAADVVLIGGFAPGAPTAPDLTAEIGALLGTGRSLALAHLPSPTDLAVPARRPEDDLVALIRERDVGWFLPEQPVSAALAVVRDPAVVPLSAAVLDGLSADGVLLVVDEDPSGRFDPEEVEAVLARGSRAIRWLASTEALAGILRARVPVDHVLPPAHWAVVPPAQPAGWTRTPQALVGMLTPNRGLSRRHLTDWAARGLPGDPGTRVWCPAGGARLSARVGRTVLALRGTRTDPGAFLRHVPYLTVPPTPGRAAHLDGEVVRALAHGCVVFLDPAYREHFGAAALYPDERSVDDWIRLHTQHPELYREQQDRGGEFLTERLGPEVAQATVRHMLDRTAGG